MFYIWEELDNTSKPRLFAISLVSLLKYNCRCYLFVITTSKKLRDHEINNLLDFFSS